MWAFVCLIAFILNCVLAFMAFSNGAYLLSLQHSLCALLCSFGFLEFKKKGD